MLPAEEKVRIALSISAGEVSVAEAAREEEAGETTTTAVRILAGLLLDGRLALSACAADPNTIINIDGTGFRSGLWHRLIIPITLVICYSPSASRFTRCRTTATGTTSGSCSA